ncbi:hypothetical protein HMPREF0063_10593 [Aeromicrobium marinum DSM 15272]|uniref:Secreted protein n=1 Tax=Aeromicrobium marinum DSM 15272 TaxID=585531 RepID=E2S9F3_9ACTN|nr:DUF6167 family protein [Aeromicrobium marinum]EFQ83877.1 hypothetical protein HMPREF0063_10593 [Aeromicrobium marinum DSM 15272]
MRPRVVWFVAGTAAGVYASVKARRAAERLSMPGLVDQAAALGTGWRAFSAEVQEGMAERERDVLRSLHERACTPQLLATPHPLDTHHDKDPT